MSENDIVSLVTNDEVDEIEEVWQNENLNCEKAIEHKKFTVADAKQNLENLFSFFEQTNADLCINKLKICKDFLEKEDLNKNNPNYKTFFFRK